MDVLNLSLQGSTLVTLLHDISLSFMSFFDVDFLVDNRQYAYQSLLKLLCGHLQLALLHTWLTITVCPHLTTGFEGSQEHGMRCAAAAQRQV